MASRFYPKDFGTYKHFPVILLEVSLALLQNLAQLYLSQKYRASCSLDINKDLKIRAQQMQRVMNKNAF